MKPLLIILTGHAPNAIRARFGDFDHWFRLALRLPARDIRVIDVSAGQTLPEVGEVRAAVISGSAAMVTERLAWSEQLAGWIRHAMDVELPLFGVCYGHQLMAHALGGRVDVLPGGREIGTQDIDVLPPGVDDPLLHGLPASFAGHTTHVQSVLEVPAGAQVLARSARDPRQILRYGPNAVSTQLHPEFSAAVMRAYLRLRADHLRNESMDVVALLNTVRATPQARRLLQRFARQTMPRAMDVVA
ncbi:MAG TPA: glutamine amidotransferase [Oleiagrimonas sp.]|nr:glutamine amidotransferase [Oleiagrimonas sp.]